MLMSELDRRFNALRAEFGAGSPSAPKVVRVETIAPAGSGRVVDVAMLRERQASATCKGQEQATTTAPIAARRTKLEEAPSNATPPPSQSKKNAKRKKTKSSSSSSTEPQAGTSGSVPEKKAEVWAEVVGRKKKRAAKAAAATEPTPGPLAKASSGGGKGGGQPTRAVRLPRSAGAAAITLTAPAEGECTLQAAMSKVREHIKISDLGIDNVRPKRAVTGGLILEIPGPEGAQKADRLAVRMTEVLQGSGVKVARPVKHAEVRVSRLEDSITPAKVAQAVARTCQCAEGDVKVGEIRRAPSGLGSAWVRAPLSAVRKLSESGKLEVGWVAARVEILATRPLQCYRCLEVGHVRQRCTSEVDRSGRCYRCGAADHRAADCTAAPKCPLCSDTGRPENHRLGAKCCAPAKKGRIGKGARTQPQLDGTSPTQQSGEDQRPKPQRRNRQEEAVSAGK